MRSSTQVARAANTSQYTIVIFTWTPPTSKDEAKIFFAWPKPSMSLMSSVATLLVTSFVTARLAPWRIRNVPSRKCRKYASVRGPAQCPTVCRGRLRAPDRAAMGWPWLR